MKALHRSKQERDILLRQIRILLMQSLARIKCQRLAAPPLPGFEKWRRYLAGGLENHAQVRIDALIPAPRTILLIWYAG